MVDNTTIIDLKLGTLKDQVTSDMKAMIIDEVTTKIKEYCNIDNIPNELKYTHANMVVDMVKYYLSNSVGSSGTASSTGDITSSGVVSSINLGDMSLSISTSGGGDKTAHANALDDILFNYRDSLNNYRNPNNYL